MIPNNAERDDRLPVSCVGRKVIKQGRNKLLRHDLGEEGRSPPMLNAKKLYKRIHKNQILPPQPPDLG